MTLASSHHAERFETLGVQTYAAQLGMWVFIASEVLFFSALFTLYAATRAAYPREFASAAGETNLLLGSLNTYVLLTASFLVAWALHAIRHGADRTAARLLGAAAALGVVFLGLKGVEYVEHLRAGLAPGLYFDSPRLHGRGYAYFFALYYAMTGLHALHVAGGIVLLAWIARRTARHAYDADYHTPIELGGMYWHFVDVVWLFLWPAFYLLR
jgi:cytochrome c oxidase subunit 3